MGQFSKVLLTIDKGHRGPWTVDHGLGFAKHFGFSLVTRCSAVANNITLLELFTLFSIFPIN